MKAILIIKQLTIYIIKTRMMFFALLTYLLGLSLPLVGQQCLWVKDVRPIYQTSDVRDPTIAVDALGNVFTTGNYGGDIDLDPTLGSCIVGNTDGHIFITKFDSNGNFIWGKAGGDAVSRGITVDANGFIYIIGYFVDTADLDPGINTFNLIATGNEDIFISKLDSNGNFVWAKSIGGLDDDNGGSISLDAYGNIYTYGSFRDTVDFDPGTGIYNITVYSSGNFVCKLDSNGNFLWAKEVMGRGFDIIGERMRIDRAGNVYLTDHFLGLKDFDPDTGVYMLNGGNYYDIFVCKLNANGNFVWAKKMGGSDNDYGVSIAVDLFGNVYTTGSFEGTADFDPGLGVYNLVSAGWNDIFISKLDSNGSFVWVKQLGSLSAEDSYDIVTDTNGNVYAAGRFSHPTVDFDPGVGIYNLQCFGHSDVFLIKLDSNGNLVWANSAGGTDGDAARSIAVDINANLYVTGFFERTASFNPFLIGDPLAFDRRLFTAKYSPCNFKFSTHTVTACIQYVWINGWMYTSSNNSATYKISNASGCDSIIRLNLTIIPINTTVTQNGIYLISNQLGASYKWLNCNNGYSVINGATFLNYTPTSNGSYAVEVTKNGCTDTSACYTVIVNDINENPNSGTITVYPNPTSGNIVIHLAEQLNSVEVIVTNTLGQQISKEKYSNTSNLNLNIPGRSGVYFLFIKTDNETVFSKVIKQ